MASTTNYESGEITTLALALDIAMRLDASARARYEQIYGHAFEFLTANDGTEIVTATSTEKTVR